MPPPISNFGDAIGRSAERMTAFADATTRSVSSVSGLSDTFRSVSRTTVGLGAGLAALGGPLGKLIGLPLAAAGAAGMVAGAGLGLAGAAAPNGLASVDKAFDLLAGSIGTILLPGVVALGGVAIMAADRVQSWIDKHLDSIIDKWVTAIEGATSAIDKFAWALQHPGEAMAEGSLALHKAVGIPGPETTDPVGERVQELFKQSRERRNGGFAGVGFGAQGGARNGNGVWAGANWMGKEFGGVGAMGVGGLPGQDKGWQKELADNMRMITRDMQMSIRQPSITDSVGKWKEAALQIQQSELEMRKLEMQQKAIDASNRLADALEKKAGGGNQVNGPVIGGRIRVP